MSYNKTKEEHLNECDYISQDEDTVYINEEAIHETMENYANQKLIEVLEYVTCKGEIMPASIEHVRTEIVQRAHDKLKELTQ